MRSLAVQAARGPLRGACRKPTPAAMLPTQRAFAATSSRVTSLAPAAASTSTAATDAGPAAAASNGTNSRFGGRAAAAVFAGVASVAALATVGINGNSANAEPEVVKDEDDVSFDGARFYIPTSEDSKIKIFSGNGNWHLANEISMNLGTQLGRAVVGRHADGEVKVSLLDSVRGQDVYVVQPLASPVNENLMELIFMVTTLRRASARKITAVVPYYGYSRSSQREGSRSPIASADVAKLLQEAGVDRVITVDLHHAQIQGFFGPSCPVDNLDVSGVAIPYFQTKFLKNPVVISPDANGAARAKSFRDKLIRHGLSASLALIVDHSPAERGVEAPANVEDEWTPEAIKSMELVGDVKGRDCIIFDDLVDSAGRITKAAAKLKAAGARRIFAFATHGLFTGRAIERIEKSELIEVACSNTLPHASGRVGGVTTWEMCGKVHHLSVGALLAEAIRRINEKESISELFF